MIGNIFPDTEWERARIGCFTSSEIHHLFTEPKNKEAKEKGELSEAAKKYIHEKASELLTGTIRQFTSMATDWGNDQEPNAIEELRKTFKNIEYFGNESRRFFKYGKFSGGSPDAVNGIKWRDVFEVKCPENPANHVENLLIKNSMDLKAIHKDYWHQIQMNMACVAKETGHPFMKMDGYFVSYCPLMEEKSRMKFLVVPPDMEFYSRLDSVLEKAENHLADIINKLA